MMGESSGEAKNPSSNGDIARLGHPTLQLAGQENNIARSPRPPPTPTEIHKLAVMCPSVQPRLVRPTSKRNAHAAACCSAVSGVVDGMFQLVPALSNS